LQPVPSTRKARKIITPPLKLALHSYLRDEAPSLELAAAIAGLSTRTLQRQLAEENFTYRRKGVGVDFLMLITK